MWFKNDVMSVVENAMKKRGWKYARISDEGVLTGVGAGGGVGPMLISIRHDEARRTLVLHVNPAREGAGMLQAAISGAAPFVRVHTKAGHTSAQVARVCEALLKLNYQSLLGNIERDSDDGEVRFRVALPYRDASVTVDQVNWCIDIGVGSAAAAMLRIQEILGTGSAAVLDEV